MGRVLLAEDEPALLEAYAEIVAGLGHECVRTCDGDEALALVRERPPDVVVSDYMMPGKNGLELARAMKADARLANIPVIVLSAGRPPQREQRQAWRFLAKPVSIDVFERHIEEAFSDVQRRAAEPPSPRASYTHVSPISFAREEMLSWVSHEIKSPLAAAMTAAQLATRNIRSGEPAETLLRRISIISRQLSRMNELVNSLLDAAALQDGRLEMQLADVDAAAFLEESVSYWSEMHPDVRFEVACGDGPTLVDSDRERLRQVVDNLLSNAIKYGRPRNHVTVTLRSDTSCVQIAVTDEGCGIPPDELPRIFDRFHRVLGQGGRGHGLGLYIAAALTRLHGGTIEVASEVGVGSTFTVSLPRASAA